jgi:hypothetical protein
MKKVFAATALAAAILQAPAHAQSLDSLLNGVDFTVGGFGTLGTVKTNTDAAQFVRDGQPSGATKTLSEKVDSNLAVQATARVNSWLSATVQILDAQRQYSSYMTADVSWAYLKIDPIENLTFKLGRVELPLFAISDSRDIGYANTWVRPPNEVYGLANLESLNGAQATYTLPIGPTHLSVTGFVGNSKLYIGVTSKYNGYDVHGGELRWETDWVTLRAGIATSKNPVPAAGIADHYTFSGFGLLVDHNNIVAQAESVRRYDTAYQANVDAKGWYALGGYRFGKVLPFAWFAKTTVPDQGSYLVNYDISAGQNTKGVGLRWDAFKSADLKFQFERVDPMGAKGISFAQSTPSFGKSTVNAISLAVDFVF